MIGIGRRIKIEGWRKRYGMRETGTERGIKRDERREEQEKERRVRKEIEEGRATYMNIRFLLF